MFLTIFLICFWFILPFPMIWLDVGGYRSETFNVNEFSTSTSILSLPVIYFKTLTFTIPTINIYFARLMNIIQIITLIVAFLIIWKD